MEKNSWIRMATAVIGTALFGLLLVAALANFSAHAAGVGPKICDPNIKYSGVFVGTDDFVDSVNNGTGMPPPDGLSDPLSQTGAEFDPQRLAKKLRDTCAGGTGGWGAASQNVIVESGAPNTAPSAAIAFNNSAPGVRETEVRDAIDGKQQAKQPGDEFVFYFAGHANAVGISLDGGDQLTWEELRQMLSGTYPGMTAPPNQGFKNSVTVTVVIDTCEAGSFAPAITAGGGIKNRDGNAMDVKHLKVLMAVAAGCTNRTQYQGNDTNLEWFNENAAVIGLATEFCGPKPPAPNTGAADGDGPKNDAGDGDCFGGAFTKDLRTCLAVGMTSRQWFDCAKAMSTLGANGPLQYPANKPPPTPTPTRTPTATVPAPPPTPGSVGGVSFAPPGGGSGGPDAGLITVAIASGAAVVLGLGGGVLYVRRRRLN